MNDRGGTDREAEVHSSSCAWDIAAGGMLGQSHSTLVHYEAYCVGSALYRGPVEATKRISCELLQLLTPRKMWQDQPCDRRVGLDLSLPVDWHARTRQRRRRGGTGL